MKYDLEERTEKFSQDVIDFARTIKKDAITLPLISQFVRSATSVGANYREANGACSRKDFKNKVFLCKKEIKETEYWLKMINRADKETIEDSELVKKEANELILIFSKIVASVSKDNK